jgi:hypothetical protein
LVSDTGRNRVFLWEQLPKGAQAAPSRVLGQVDTQQTERNHGTTASASSLQYPSGIWSDGRRVVVADAWNHRVLIWQQWPTYDGQPADLVLGQPDFTSNQPNVKGLGSVPSAQSLYWPYGVFSDGNSLWVADTGNRRVLYWETFPEASQAPADGVIGQATMQAHEYDKHHAIWPYSLKIGPQGQLAIVDTSCYRVLLWRDWRQALAQPAEVILGQKDFEAMGQNQFRLHPEAFTMNWGYDVAFAGDQVIAADTGNSRVLWWNRWPTQHSAPADGLLGQASLQEGGENRYSMDPTHDSLYWPFSLSYDQGRLAVADTGNHRIMIYPWQFPVEVP